MNDVSRRDFLQVATGGAFATLGALAPGEAAADQPSFAPQAVPAAGDPLLGWFDRPMRWAQLTLVENDPGHVRSAVLARLLQAPARGRRLPERRRHRRLLPDRGPAPPPQRWLGETDPFGTLLAGCRALGMRVDRAHRSARRAGRCQARASRLDCRRPPTASRAVTGRIRICGSRARSARTTSSSWTSVHREIVDEVPRGRHLREPLGAHRATATACTARRTSRPRRGLELPRTTDRRDPARRRVSRVAQRAADRALEARGTRPIRAANPDARFIPNGPPD